jgi:hypothetical protein
MGDLTNDPGVRWKLGSDKEYGDTTNGMRREVCVKSNHLICIMNIRVGQIIEIIWNYLYFIRFLNRVFNFYME